MENISRFFLDEQKTIQDTLGTIDKCAKGLAILVDNKKIFIRTITDGDIRRALLAGENKNSSISKLKPVSSITVSIEDSSDVVLKLMNKHQIDHIPALNDKKEVIKIFSRKDFYSKIPLAHPHLGSKEEEYVKEAFRTNWIAPLGPNVDKFEQEISSYINCKSAAATSSGTSAIHLALRLLNIEKGDKVLCSSFTFIASCAPIVYQHAEPVFVDSDMTSWNMSSKALRAAILDQISLGARPKAIILVHIYGACADMNEIVSISQEFSIPIIEDAAEALGSTFEGKYLGTFGELGIFSFNGNKIITTSSGGMLVSNNEALIDRARYLSTQAKESSAHYEHVEIGYNYRMSNILAGIGRGQLTVLDQRIITKRKIFNNYKKGLSDLKEISWIPEIKECFSNCWLSVAILNPTFRISVKTLIERLAELSIECRHVWKPMHMQSVFKKNKYYKHEKNIDCSKFLFEHAFCLPSYTAMGEEKQNYVVRMIKKILSK